MPRAPVARLASLPPRPGLCNLSSQSPFPSPTADDLQNLGTDCNGTPLQCSCLENPMDGGAWWLQSMRSLRVRLD